jgi:hypothetical protein
MVPPVPRVSVAVSVVVGVEVVASVTVSESRATWVRVESLRSDDSDEGALSASVSVAEPVS